MNTPFRCCDRAEDSPAGKVRRGWHSAQRREGTKNRKNLPSLASSVAKLRNDLGRREKNVAPASSRQKVCCKQRTYPHPHAGKMPARRFLCSFSASARRFATETS